MSSAVAFSDIFMPRGSIAKSVPLSVVYRSDVLLSKLHDKEIIKKTYSCFAQWPESLGGLINVSSMGTCFRARLKFEIKGKKSS